MVQKRYAYLMGANGPEQGERSRLKYAENDAKRLANAFSAFPCEFTEAEYVIAEEPDPTLRKLQRLSNKCGPSDLLVVHFAGHALLDEQLYLLCNKTEVDALIGSAIDIKLVKDILRRCQASHKLLVLDCCHARAAYYDALRDGQKIEDEVKVVLKETSRGSASAILAACSDHERTRELEMPDGGAGFLSWVLAAACTTHFNEVSRDHKSLSLNKILNWLPKVLDQTNKGLSEKDQIPIPSLLIDQKLAKDYEIWFTSQKGEAVSPSGYDELRRREELELNKGEEYLRRFTNGPRIEDFDKSKVIAYAKFRGVYNDLNDENIGELCRELDLSSTAGFPRRAAVLAFHPTPEIYLDSAIVSIIVEMSDGTKHLRKDIGGLLAAQAENSVEWIKSHLDIISENVGSGKRVDRYEIPDEAIRELVVNAILHRDYESKASVRIIITPKQIIITNPGELDSSILECTPPFAYRDSLPHNPFLLRVLVAQQWAEGHSRGFKTVLEKFTEYNLELPKISNLSSGLVQVTINRPEQLPKELRTPPLVHYTAAKLALESSIVLITSVDEDNRNFGTGFIIDQDAGYSYILTCAHVVRKAEDKEGKVKVNNIIAEVAAIGTPDGANDLAVLQVEGLLGTPLTRRNIGNEGMSFTSFGYQKASFPTTEGSKESLITNSLHGELGELNFQRIRGQGFPIKLWTLKIKDDFLPLPGYSGAPVVVKTEAGEDVVIGVLSMQQRERILAISIEELDRVWPEQTFIPFTDREDELKLILSSSAPAYYLLDAPAGYGKSTLLRELQKRFSERKWSCAYLALDSFLEFDDLAEAVAENLSISLSSPKSNQSAGYRLGSALQRYWNNSQEGLVLLFDLDLDSGSSQFLERLLEEFIPEIAESLEHISPFDRGDNRFRVVIAGRYLNSYYNRLSIQKLPIVPSRLYLTPFNYDVVYSSSVDYLKQHKRNQVRQIAGHIFYLTGGHPGCIAKVLKLYKERGMSPERFMDRLSVNIWNEIVKPVVNSIATKIPFSSGVQKLMSSNVLRYMDYAALKKLIDLLEISEVGDEIDLADQLTYSTSLYWNNHLLHDDITRRLICIELRNDRRDEFAHLCRTAQTICEEILRDNSTIYPDMWAIEYLFQFLQQHSLLISKSEQRRELHDKFISQELPKVLEWLVKGREAREQKRHLLRSIEEDWEFMFTVNYYLRRTEHNDDAVKELKAAVIRML